LKDLMFKKKCNPGFLSEELRNAGFLIYGVSAADDLTIIHLYDEETKDPKPIVDTHVYVEPLTSTEIRAQWQKRFKEATTVSEQVLILAEFLGIKVS